MTKVLFRVDAGRQIGLGHLQRSLALAAALRKLEVESQFLVDHDSGAGDRIHRSGYPVETLPRVESWSAEDCRATLDTANSQECPAVIVDSHRATAEYLSDLRSSGIFLIGRDDLARFPLPCQMVMNGNADAEKLRYVSSSGDTVFLLGTRYTVLGEEFWDLRSRADDRTVENVLVTLGGTDEFNLMPKLLETLERLPGGFTITAIVGPYFENISEVKDAASRMARQVKLSQNLPSLHDAIIEADLAVSAAGQTLYELARAGCPTVGFSVASNQQGQLTALGESGFLVSAGDAETDDVPGGVGEAVCSLIGDPLSRSAMAAAGRRLVDGQGAIRVAQSIVDGMGSPAANYAQSSPDRVK